MRKKEIEKENKLSCKEVKNALNFTQPHLEITEEEGGVSATGKYVVSDRSNNDGPLAYYDIYIFFDENYPDVEPHVVEKKGKIPRCLDRHMYPRGDGRCCVGIWEAWRITSDDISVKAFCNGPLHNFFLSQLRYEQSGVWPFDEYSHGIDGIKEGIKDAVESILGYDVEIEQALNYVRFLANNTNIKGHWLCPCNSGLILRKCHSAEIKKINEHMWLLKDLYVKYLRYIKQ